MRVAGKWEMVVDMLVIACDKKGCRYPVFVVDRIEVHLSVRLSVLVLWLQLLYRKQCKISAIYQR